MPNQHGAVYISGPMRGYDGCNFDAFYEAEQWLTEHGFGPIYNPARKDEDSGFKPAGDCTEGITPEFLHTAMRWDVEKVLSSRTIVLLPGWAASEGAKMELAVARAIGVRVAEMIYQGGEPSHLFFTSAEDLDSHAKFAATPSTIPPERIKFGPHRAVIDGPTLVRSIAESAISGNNPAETRVVNAMTGGAKGSKLARFDLLPQGPLWEVAELYGRGAEKYEPRNWERGYDWSLSFAALMRHASLFWQGEDIDAETTKHHMASVAFHAFALMEFGRSHPELDDRSAA